MIESNKTSGFRGWLIVASLFIIAMLNYLDRTMITTMRTSIVEAIPMSDAKFGLLTSVFLWVYGLCSPVAGYVADRYNRSYVIITSLFIWSAVTWLTAHATNFEQLLATRALMGLSEACYIPAALALIADYHRDKTRSLATGIHQAGIMMGQSLGFVGGWIAENSTWNHAFAILGLIGVVYAVVMIFILRQPAKKNPLKTDAPRKVSFRNGIITLMHNANFLKVLGYWAVFSIVGWLITGWLPTFYKERFTLSQTDAGIYATAYLYPASMVGVIFGGWIADRWSRTRTRARILVVVIGLLVSAPFILLASITHALALVIAFFLVYAFTRAFGDANVMPILCMIGDERYRATAYGTLNMFGTIIGGIALYAGGFLRDHQVSLSLIYQLAAILLLCCAAFMYFIKTNTTFK